jgi:hypothetical protein
MESVSRIQNLSVEKRTDALVKLGLYISDELDRYKSGQNEKLGSIIRNAGFENAWFTDRNIILALENWKEALKEENVKTWLEKYKNILNHSNSPKTVGVINAGNIPFVGLHDLLSVIIAGHSYLAKNASGDTILLPFIAQILTTIEPLFEERIQFVQRIEKVDAVIATGNNNSSRYFEYYFRKYPHIIRKNRNGVGVLFGDESKEQLHAFGKDIFSYFGLGCRNISKIYVPENYNFNFFFESVLDYSEIMNHSKYMNNFDYHTTVYLLKKIPFLQNGFLIVTEEKQIASPVSVLHYEKYPDLKWLEKKLSGESEQIQCIVSAQKVFSKNSGLNSLAILPGESQSPALWDYADGVNTLDFLCSIL